MGEAVGKYGRVGAPGVGVQSPVAFFPKSCRRVRGAFGCVLCRCAQTNVHVSEQMWATQGKYGRIRKEKAITAGAGRNPLPHPSEGQDVGDVVGIDLWPWGWENTSFVQD